MQVEPLKKELFDRAKEAGVTKIVLRFSGGNDEGFLDIELGGLDYSSEYKSLWGDIENWVWDVYSYSGAGDGTSYGDDITYDLVAGKVTTQEWAHVQQMGDECHDTLETR